MNTKIVAKTWEELISKIEEEHGVIVDYAYRNYYSPFIIAHKGGFRYELDVDRHNENGSEILESRVKRVK